MSSLSHSSACDPLCGSCTGPSATECLTCAPAAFNAFAHTPGWCAPACPSHYFHSGGQICEGEQARLISPECNQFCLECFGPSQHECAGCVASAFSVYFQGSTCDASCALVQPGYFRNYTSMTCDPCHPLC